MAESDDIIARDAHNAARFSPDVGQEQVGEIYARAWWQRRSTRGKRSPCSTNWTPS